jgi:hypothetical protein
MPEFVLLFVGRAARPEATDAQTAEYNQQWAGYMRGLGEAGQLRAGAPFEPTGQVVSRDGPTDLELAEVDIGGYLVVETESLEAAVEIAGRAPHIALGGKTIVRPCVAVGPPGE